MFTYVLGDKNQPHENQDSQEQGGWAWAGWVDHTSEAWIFRGTPNAPDEPSC